MIEVHLVSAIPRYRDGRLGQRLAARTGGERLPRLRRHLSHTRLREIAYTGRKCRLQPGPLRARECHAVVRAIERLELAFHDVARRTFSRRNARIGEGWKRVDVAACRIGVDVGEVTTIEARVDGLRRPVLD